MDWSEQAERLCDLAGEECRCGQRKAGGYAFCRSCFFSLPQSFQIGIATAERARGAFYKPVYLHAAAKLDEKRGGTK